MNRNEIFSALCAEQGANAQLKVKVRAIYVSNGRSNSGEVTDKKVTIKFDSPICKRVDNTAGKETVQDVDFANLSLVSFLGAVRDNAKLAGLISLMRENTKSISLLFSDCTLDLVQQYVVAGTEYVNPFAEDSTKKTTFAANKYITHVSNITLGVEGDNNRKVMTMAALGVLKVDF